MESSIVKGGERWRGGWGNNEKELGSGVTVLEIGFSAEEHEWEYGGAIGKDDLV